MSWKEEANCSNLGLDKWFSRRSSDDGQEAIAICSSCPVKQECLDYALSFETSDGLRIGIWGGLGPNDRATYAKENDER